MRITIPDDLADQYDAYTAGTDLDTVVTRQLARTAHCPPSQPITLLTEADRDQLADALGVPAAQLHDAKELIRLVTAHGQVSFENVRIPLTPSQKLELAERARREQQDVKVYVQRIVDAVLTDFLWTAGPATPLTSREQQRARKSAGATA